MQGTFLQRLEQKMCNKNLVFTLGNAEKSILTALNKSDKVNHSEVERDSTW